MRAILLTSGSSAGHPSLWSVAESGTPDVAAKALCELAGSYWYCVYAWWRRAGLDAKHAATGTLACFTRWTGSAPPAKSDTGAESLRLWLVARVNELAIAGVKLLGPAAITIDPAAAEEQFLHEPGGSQDSLFHRRWALTVLSLTMDVLEKEYAAGGRQAELAMIKPFLGYGMRGDAAYSEVSGRLSMSKSAARKAVFESRVKFRTALRAVIADTVAREEEIDPEMTALLCAL